MPTLPDGTQLPYPGQGDQGVRDPGVASMDPAIQAQILQSLGNPYATQPGAPPAEQEFVRETAPDIMQQLQQYLLQGGQSYWILIM
jgi:hypothetical protein